MNKFLGRYVEKYEKLQESLALICIVLSTSLSLANSQGWINSKVICYSIASISAFCGITSLLVYNYKKKVLK